MKTEAVNSWFLSTVFRSMVRILRWAVGDLLSPINQWFFSVLPETLLLQKPWGLPFNSLKRVQNQVCFAEGDTGCSAAEGQEDLACRCHIRHLSIMKCPSPWGSKGMLGSGTALPCQKLDFLWRSEGPIPPAWPLNCQVTPWKAAHGFSLSSLSGNNDTVLQGDLPSWVFPGT